tara:strand:- start:546 stop:869 length:324 start_codon:yes stop_codon:yes gene_type:complete
MKRIKVKLTAKSKERLVPLFKRFEQTPEHTLHNELTNAYILRLALFEAVKKNVDVSEKLEYDNVTSLLVPEWLIAAVSMHAQFIPLADTEALSRFVNAGLELLEGTK